MPYILRWNLNGGYCVNSFQSDGKFRLKLKVVKLKREEVEACRNRRSNEKLPKVQSQAILNPKERAEVLPPQVQCQSSMGLGWW